MRALLLVVLSVAVFEGRHLRLDTERGPVHVFFPKGYDARTAGTVLYVHGYFDDVDSAWADHELEEQFQASGRNALFIAPEAPISDFEEVRWGDLGELLAAVREAGVVLPKGPTVAVAHSGGYRTVRRWLDTGGLRAVVLLDGLYGAQDELSAWVGKLSAPASLVLVGSHTTERTEKFIEGRDDVHELEALDAERPQRRIVFVRSKLEHMEMVTGGLVIPAVLQWMPLSPSPQRGEGRGEGRSAGRTSSGSEARRPQ